MTLKFLGTRGEIDVRSQRHRMHSSLLLGDGRKVIIDCGTDWAGRVTKLHPEAILLTHAHADHAAGLKNGSPCPVVATAETWEILKRYPIEVRRVISSYETFEIGRLAFEAFPVEHSLRAPAVGYRVKHASKCLFYVPDVAAIPEPSRVFDGVDFYIGDGATMVRPLVRKRGDVLIGHASIESQLEWCQKHRVRRAIFTHCGSQIVAGDERKILLKLDELSGRCGVQASLAHDGLEIKIA